MTQVFQPSSYDHKSPNQTGRIGLLLVNLGTPEAPTAQSVRPYLKQFLSDRRVVEVPRWLWWLVLNGVILPFRSGRSAKAYAKIWRDDGSPLMVFSQRLGAALGAALNADLGAGLDAKLDAALNKDPSIDGVQTSVAMTYGSPGIPDALAQMKQQGVQRLLVLPLYPQYSATTTGSVFDAVTNALQKQRWLPELRFINQYFQHPPWYQAVAESIRDYQQQHGQGERLLFSFHGIPQRYFRQGDPYYCQCHASARLIAQELGLDDDSWQVTFQSRLGREPWLQPYTDKVLEQFGQQGGKHVQVVCPGFAVDCLETLEEIAMQNQAFFIEAGGKQLDYIAALNDSPSHVQTLAGIVKSHLAGWPETMIEDDGNRYQRAIQRAKLDGYDKDLVNGK